MKGLSELGGHYMAPGSCCLPRRCLSVSAIGCAGCYPTNYFGIGQGNCLLGSNSFGTGHLPVGWEPAHGCRKDWAGLAGR